VNYYDTVSFLNNQEYYKFMHYKKGNEVAVS